MNSFERKELKRASISKEKWKDRALEYKIELRKKDDRIRDLTESRDKWRNKATATQSESEDLKKNIQQP